MPTSRITDTFARASGESRAVLVSYLMAGDPDLETSYAAMCALRDNGADIIELGAPFTDPMADGASIQKAGLRALANKTKLADTLALAARFRAEDQTTPVIIMGYANPVFRMGYVEFAKAAHAAGVDGTILVDLPPEEDGELRAAAAMALSRVSNHPTIVNPAFWINAPAKERDREVTEWKLWLDSP